jgi:flagellar hook-basal body complex protein FliE
VLKRAEQNLGKGAGVTDFSDRIGDALNQVASAQSDSASLTRAYEMGAEHDLSKVMVQQQVSSLGFQMTLNVRNKVLSAYKDIMNMPV